MNVDHFFSPLEIWRCQNNSEETQSSDSQFRSFLVWLEDSGRVGSRTLQNHLYKRCCFQLYTWSGYTLLPLGSPVPNMGRACLETFIRFAVIHGQKFASNSYYWTTRFSGSSCYANNSRKTTESIIYVMTGGMMTVITIIITKAKVETTIYWACWGLFWVLTLFKFATKQ